MLRLNVTGKGTPVPGFKKFPAALAQKFSEGVTAAKHVITEFLYAKYFVKRSEVNKSITGRITNRKKGNNSAYIKVTGRRLSLDKYKLAPTKPPKSKRILSAGVKRPDLKPLEPQTFLYAPSGGSFKPFARRGKERLPIDKLVGPAVPQLVEWNTELQEQMIDIVRQHIMNAMKEGTA